MPQEPLTETEYEEGLINDSLRNDMEFWYDGKNTIRFGFDVAAGLAVELHVDDIGEFHDQIDSGETTRQSFPRTNKMYLFENGERVYYDTDHVATFTDFERYPMYAIMRHVRDLKVDWDPEQLARERLEHLVDHSTKLVINGKQNGSVDVSLYRSEYAGTVSLHPILKIARMDCTGGWVPDGDAIESTDDFLDAVEKHLDGVDFAIMDPEESPVKYHGHGGPWYSRCSLYRRCRRACFSCDPLYVHC